jgi:hypothetical protein
MLNLKLNFLKIKHDNATYKLVQTEKQSYILCDIL